MSPLKSWYKRPLHPYFIKHKTNITQLLALKRWLYKCIPDTTGPEKHTQCNIMITLLNV